MWRQSHRGFAHRLNHHNVVGLEADAPTWDDAGTWNEWPSDQERHGLDSVVVKKLGEDDTRTSDLWDNEIDGGSPKPSHDLPTSKVSIRPRVAIGAVGCLIPLVLFAAFLARELGRDLWFHSQVSIVNQRARRLGGGVGTGRRAFRDHVGAWFHGKEIIDLAMPEIVSIIRECQSRGLGGAHLSLDLSRTSVGDDGIRLLHSVAGLEMVSIRDTNVTKDGVDSLRNSLPNTHVDARPIYPPGKAQTERGPRTQSP
jgi:hypothetical protein